MGARGKGPRIVILTGAGISAESGISTFRDSDGLWEKHRIEDVASPEGFARDPRLVQAFYDARRRAVREALPNAAHVALAELERSYPGDVVIITQNVGDLHERAGSSSVVHVHGAVNSAWCTGCGERHEWIGDLAGDPPCPACGLSTLRPDIVWFGEAVYAADEIYAAVEGCELFAVIGSSGVVYPDAGLTALAKEFGARTVLLNLELREGDADFDHVEFGPASVVVPAWVDRLRHIAQQENEEDAP